MCGKPGDFCAAYINIADLIAACAAVWLALKAQAVLEKLIRHKSASHCQLHEWGNGLMDFWIVGLLEKPVVDFSFQQSNNPAIHQSTIP